MDTYNKKDFKRLNKFAKKLSRHLGSIKSESIYLDTEGDIKSWLSSKKIYNVHFMAADKILSIIENPMFGNTFDKGVYIETYNTFNIFRKILESVLDILKVAEWDVLEIYGEDPINKIEFKERIVSSLEHLLVLEKMNTISMMENWIMGRASLSINHIMDEDE